MLVTLEQAKHHLRVDFSDFDDDIQAKLNQAEDIVIDYLKTPDHGWDADTVPELIKAAILLVLSNLYEYRTVGDAEILSTPVRAILHRYRDPALS